VRTSIWVVLLANTAVAAAQSAPAPAAGSAPAAHAAPQDAAASAYYRIELAPSGSYVSIGAPALRNGAMVFKAYPDGKVMSLRKSDIKKISPITAQEAATPAKKDLVSIGNLAMQGGSAPAAGGGARGSGARATTSGNGPAVVSTRDGIAITTGSTAAAASVAGPAVTSTHDGMVVTAQPPQ
jgi:hypothetical protein